MRLRWNRWDEAGLLQDTLDEEGRADNRLSAIADVNPADYLAAEVAPVRPA